MKKKISIYLLWSLVFYSCNTGGDGNQADATGGLESEPTNEIEDASGSSIEISSQSDNDTVFSYTFPDSTVLYTVFESIKPETDIGITYLKMEDPYGKILWEQELEQGSNILANSIYIVKVVPESSTVQVLNRASGKINIQSSFRGVDLSDGGEPQLVSSNIIFKLIDDDYQTYAVAAISLPELTLDTIDSTVKGYVSLQKIKNDIVAVYSNDGELIKELVFE